MSSTLTIEQARKLVERAETKHRAAQSKAEDELAEIAEVVEDPDSDETGPSTDEVAELFADADKAAQEVDKARRVLSSVLAKHDGTDPSDMRPAHGDQVAAVATGHRIGVHIAKRVVAADRFKEAIGTGDAEKVKAALIGAQLFTAEQFSDWLAGDGVSLAATFDGGPLVPSERRRDVFPLPQDMPLILEWFAQSTTSSNAIDYYRQTARTVSPGNVGPGDAAPEATLVYTQATATVRDRGVGIPVPKSNLSDEGRIRSLIANDLIPELRLDAQDQALNGDGTGTNMTGLANTANVNTYTRIATDTIADAIHKGITAARVASLREPNAVATTAVDHESMVLAKGDDGHYVNSQGPFGAVPLTLWGKRHGVAHNLASETALVGKFDEGEFATREGPQINEFEQHGTLAAERVTYMLAHYRATFLVKRPRAFTFVTTTEVP